MCMINFVMGMLRTVFPYQSELVKGELLNEKMLIFHLRGIAIIFSFNRYFVVKKRWLADFYAKFLLGFDYGSHKFQM